MTAFTKHWNTHWRHPLPEGAPLTIDENLLRALRAWCLWILFAQVLQTVLVGIGWIQL
ncbi:MAG TPA: hypothetical protein VK600_00485 [Candidatus Saccharimonadales bacterium]|nr:hypothetical protein [Candidatus Saccharimonadales bacterium]